MNLAVIDTPSCPPGWEESRAQLIRIVDPSGCAVAWFAPEYGAMCVSFAVRASNQHGTKWTPILHSMEPRESPQSQSESGCVVRYVLSSGSPKPIQPWRFLARDPTALTMETVVLAASGDRGGEGDDGLYLHLTAHLDDATLVLDLQAQNQGAQAISPQIAFHVTLARGFLDSSDVLKQLDRAAKEHGQKQPAVPHSTGFVSDPCETPSHREVELAPVAFVAAPAYDTRVMLALAPGTSCILQTHPSPSEIRALTLLAAASPVPSVPLDSGARSCMELAIGTVLRNDRH